MGRDAESDSAAREETDMTVDTPKARKRRISTGKGFEIRNEDGRLCRKTIALKSPERVTRLLLYRSVCATWRTRPRLWLRSVRHMHATWRSTLLPSVPIPPN